VNIKRWVAAASIAAGLTTGALAVTAAPAAADSVSIVRNGCLNSDGIWFDDGPGTRARYQCVYWYPTGWMVFFYRSNGMYIGVNSGTGPINFNPDQVRTP